MDEMQPTPAESTEATTAQEAPVPDAPEQAAAEETPQAPVPDWREALTKVPADELRRHPTFAGIVGSEKQRWQAEYEQTRQAADQAAARAKAEEELRELAERNPVEFADKWLSSEQARQQQERVAALESNARTSTATAIGAAMHAIPEWESAAADPDVLARLAQAMQGKSGDAVLAAWNSTALNIVAERRAQALFEREVAARVKAERVAWETEAAAQGFRFSDRPDLSRGGRPSSADPEPDWKTQPKEWDAWYRRSNARGAA